MGKTKIKVIDASQPETEEKPKKKLGRHDDLVEKLNKELEESEHSENSDKIRKDQKVSESEHQKEQSSETLAPSDIPILSGTPSSSEFSEKTEGKSEKKVQKPARAKPRSKRYQEIFKDLDRSKTYSIPEAVDMVKKLSYAKFNATIEAHINTVQTGLRGLVSLPYASGKKLRILVFPSSPLKIEGVDFGDDSTIEEISQGKINYDLIIATFEWMPKLAKVAKFLGPKGLMPNPKNGTITSSEDGLKKAIESFQAGKTEYKTEPKAPVIHLGLGKVNQPTEELTANIKTLLTTLGKSKIKKVSLSPTMGPSVKVDLSSF